MYAVIPAYKACEEEGIKYIPGEEFYMARDSVDDRPKTKKKKKVEGEQADLEGEDEQGEKLYYHLTVLAENNDGYQNLMKLSSRAFLEGYYYRARCDWDILSDHAEGLIATTGCLGGIVLQELLHDRFDGALEAAARLQDIFGRDNLFIEIQDHDIPEQTRTNPQLLEIASILDAPVVSTNDTHYTHHDDAHSHDALICLNTGSKISDKDRFRFSSDQNYLKSAAEMRRLFREVPEAADNTLLIADRSNVKIDFGTYKIPKFPIPDGVASEAEYLKNLANAGLKKRYGSGNEIVQARLDYELDVIGSMGFSGYFLIVWDLYRHARQTGITYGAARGSVAGSVVAYCMGITEVDPIKYSLPFERFLNPSRVSMPDVDSDWDTRYREHMINYSIEKYGEDHVARIITFNQIKSRAAVRDAARVLGHPYEIGNKLAKSLPPLLFGRDTPLKDCLVESEGNEEGFRNAKGFRALYESGKVFKETVDVALGLEGIQKSDGVHAAAVVISPEPLTNYLPIQKKPKGPITTQYEMHAVEELGLLKMDFLGLRNLDVLSDTVKLIKKRHDLEFEIYNLPEDDPRTYQMLARGDTVGVFQLESTPMRSLLRQMKPKSFDDIAACIALYRPGPMAANMHHDYAERLNGRQPVTYFHPDAAKELAATQGLAIYQENVIALAQIFAGFTAAEGDLLRRAMGKKKPEEMEKQRENFLAGCVRSGYDEQFGLDLFKMIEAFSDYAFSKNHAYGYAMTTYATGFFKSNYPVEYMSALMTSVQTDQDKLTLYLNEARKIGLDVIPPDINISDVDFAPISDSEIAFGFLGIRDLGGPTAQAIVENRREHGPFKSFMDYASRSPRGATGAKAVRALIRAGCFDSLGHPRKGLDSVFASIMKAESKRISEEEKGVMRLFDMPIASVEEGIPDIHWGEDERLAIEKDYLGVYVSGHPLADVNTEKATATVSDIKELNDYNRKSFLVAGVILGAKERITKKGDKMFTFDIEDLTGRLPCVLFPRQTVEFGYLVSDGDIVYMHVEPQNDQEEIKLIVNMMSLIKKQASETGDNIHVWIPQNLSLDRLRELILRSPGKRRVVAHTQAGDVFIMPQRFSANIESLQKAFKKEYRLKSS